MAIKQVKANFIAMTAVSGEVVDAIAALANGNLVVASHKLNGAGALVYYERLFDATYTLIGAPQALNAPYATLPASKASTVVDSGDGTYWLFWYAPQEAGGSVLNTYGQHFAADGSTIGSAAQFLQFDDSAARLGGSFSGTGDAAAPVVHANAVNGATHQVSLSFYDSALAQVGGDVVIADNLSDAMQIMDVANMGGGKVLVAWKATASTGSWLFASVADTAGNTIVAPLTVAQNIVLDAEVDSFGDGSFVVTYREKYLPAPNDVRIVAKIFDAGGAFVSTASTITRSEAVYGTDYETVALTNGRIAVMWVTADHANADKTVLFLQQFDRSGEAITDEIILGHVQRSAAGINLHAELNADGKLAVNWIGLDAGVLTKHAVIYDPLVFVATDHNDGWYGTSGDETFHGLGGDDWIYGADGVDTIFGDAGDDRLGGGNGADTLNGGAGFDAASYFYDDAVTSDLADPSARTGAALGDIYVSIEGLIGSDTGADTLLGNGDANSLYGEGGDDTLRGRGGTDWLFGGDGKDVLDGGAGRDMANYYFDSAVKAYLITPGANTGAAKGDSYISIEDLRGSKTGSDTLYGNNVDNTIEGFGGSDHIYGLGGADELDGGVGNDFLFGGTGDDLLRGDDGTDVLNGGNGKDYIDYRDEKAITLSLTNAFKSAGGAAGDTFFGIEGVYGSDTGNDSITGNGFSNDLFGMGGDDVLLGMGGNDDLLGGIGHDVLDGGAGRDMADYYGEGAVTIALDGSVRNGGAAAGDKLISIEDLGGSNQFADTLIGDGNKNFLAGGGGNDKLDGRAGDDELRGGKGADTLDGGTGKDYYTYYEAAEGHDKILDFQDGDVFLFSYAVIVEQDIGWLPPSEFQSGTTNVAKDFGVYFIFRTTDDTLWLDVDGKTGSKAAVMIADLQTDYNLKASDIYIF